MKVIIAGSRSIKDYALVKRLIDEIVAEHKLEISKVISGRAYGVDRLGERWAEDNGIPIIAKAADWQDISHPDAVIKQNQRGGVYNALAGLWRNEEMAKLGDALILIHDGDSTGSLDMLQRAEKYGLPVFKRVVDIEKHNRKVRMDSYAEAVKWAKRMREDETTVVLDTESCGGSKNDEIISLAVVRLFDGKPLLNTLLRPSADVHFNHYATKVHGIKESQLVNAPRITDIYDEYYALTHQRNVLAYNHSADKRMIEQTLRKNSLDIPESIWYCVMKQFKNFTQDTAVTNLTSACQAMNVKAGTHAALDDALATARLVFRISQEYKKP